MRIESRRRKGFTLIETVTTVGIIAVMAAVVIPQVTRQFDSADPTRLQEDLKAVQSAVSAFRINVKGEFPGDLDDLANPIETNATFASAPDSGFASTGARSQYTTVELPYWIGPYVDFSIVEATAGSTRPTGFGALLMDNFVCYDATADIVGTGAGQACAAAAGNRFFLALRVSGLSATQFETINDTFDGTAEVTGTTSYTEGNLRFKTGTPNIAYFLLAPLN